MEEAKKLNKQVKDVHETKKKIAKYKNEAQLIEQSDKKMREAEREIERVA